MAESTNSRNSSLTVLCPTLLHHKRILGACRIACVIASSDFHCASSITPLCLCSQKTP